MFKTLTKEHFISEAILKHGNKYDYSLVNYKNTDTKVSIVCKEHGVFFQSPKNHKKGQNCPKCMTPEICGINNRYTLEDFIKSAEKVYEKLYDYSKSIYIDHHTKLEILCKKHGRFYRTPSLHISEKYGCPRCRKEEQSYKNSEIFFKKYKELCFNKYDLKNFKYTKSTVKSVAKCKIHGDFLITPTGLLNNNDCPKCVIENQIKKQTKPLATFLEIVNKLHNNKFDYSLITEYKGSKSKVKIICPNHGIFEQIAASHLKGIGCVKCTLDKKINYNIKEINKEENKNKPLNFYVLNLYSDKESFIKIGVTKNSLKVRYYGSKIKNYFISEILFLPTNVKEGYNLEQYILSKLKQDYKYNPLKKFPGYSECLTLDSKNKILECIKDFLLSLDKSDLVGKILDYEYKKKY